jgi:hypothetical protein
MKVALGLEEVENPWNKPFEIPPLLQNAAWCCIGLCKFMIKAFYLFNLLLIAFTCSWMFNKK